MRLVWFAHTLKSMSLSLLVFFLVRCNSHHLYKVQIYQVVHVTLYMLPQRNILPRPPARHAVITLSLHFFIDHLQQLLLLGSSMHQPSVTFQLTVQCLVPPPLTILQLMASCDLHL